MRKWSHSGGGGAFPTQRPHLDDVGRREATNHAAQIEVAQHALRRDAALLLIPERNSMRDWR